MYEYMIANAKEVLPKENTEGVEKVKKEENYAFLMESSSIEYTELLYIYVIHYVRTMTLDII